MADYTHIEKDNLITSNEARKINKVKNKDLISD